jgi:hypothetical protein
MKTDTQTLIAAMRILAKDIETEDGVANAAIAEAAEKMAKMNTTLRSIHMWIDGDENAPYSRAHIMFVLKSLCEEALE